MNTLLWILLATFVDGILGLIGIFSIWMSDKSLRKLVGILVAFSAGALLSGAFSHLLAESLPRNNVQFIFAIVMIGFVIFFLVERLLHWHHCHDGKCKVHPFTYLIVFGDGIHNFIDGLVIAASFIVSVPFGIVTTLLIIAHEIPQELGNFGILVYGGWSKLKSVTYSFLAQITCVIGGIAGYYLSDVFAGAIDYILPFAAGGFIYIAASDLVPELHKEPKMKKSMLHMGFFVLGIAFMLAVKILFGG